MDKEQREKLTRLQNRCFGKVAHATMSSAEYALGNMRIRPGELMEIYQCSCGKFHIGHKPGTKKTLKNIDSQATREKKKGKKKMTRKEMKDMLREGIPPPKK